MIFITYSISNIFSSKNSINSVIQEHLVLFAILSWDIIPPPFIFSIILNILNYLSLFIYIIVMYDDKIDSNLKTYYKASITVFSFFILCST